MARTVGKAPLSKTQIVQAAIRSADAHGPEALSMRRLAKELGVRPMALYHYFTDREALLGEVIDAVLMEWEAPEAGEPKDRLKALCRAVRALAQRHPAIFLLAMAYHRNIPADYELAEALLDNLHKAGLGPRAAVRAHNLLGTYVSGFAADELTGSLLAFEGAEAFDNLPTGRFPQLERHREHFAADLDAEFEYGLDVLLKGILATGHA